MEVRDAVEADAEILADIVDVPTEVMRNVVHDRTVRVAVVPEPDAGPNADVDGTDERQIRGVVSFDAREGTVHVTQLGGSIEARERLLREPLRFASTEGMAVELVVPQDDEAAQKAAQRVGFEEVGSGPRFEGKPTVRYRWTGR